MEHGGIQKRDLVTVLKIVLIYACFGALWILLSDRALALLFPNYQEFTEYSLYKGWLYVAVTSIFLFVLISRLFHKAALISDEKLKTLSLLETISNRSDDAVYAKDNDGNYILYNPAASYYTGKKAPDILGKNDYFLFERETAEIIIARHKDVAERGAVEHGEEAIKTSAGLRHFQTTLGPLLDVDGNVFGTFGIARDITEWRRGERELVKLNRALRLLGDCGLAIAHAESETALVEKVCELISSSGGYLMSWVGYPCHDDLKSIAIATHSRITKEYLRNLKLTWDQASPAGKGPTAKALVQGKTQIIQDVHSSPDMKDIQSLATKFGYKSNIALPLICDADRLGVLTIYSVETDVFGKEEVVVLEELAANLAFGIHSLRERQGRLAAEAASQAKSVFLANLSHEIRTPLNAISAMTNLLVRSRLTAKQQELVSKIDLAGEHLLEVISDILDLSKVEAGRITLESAPLDFNKVVTSAADMLRDRLSGKAVSLDLHLAPLPTNLLGDATRIQQIVLNFLSNAIKFTEEGRIGLTTLIEQDEADALMVRIEVADTGIGIAADAQSRLFEAFEQANESISRRYGGTGLGLAISRRLAELMGGTVGVSSNFGEGSRFWASMRLSKSSELAVQFSATDIAEPEFQLATRYAGSKILFVDDDPINRDAASMLLREFGGQDVTLAANGHEAVKLVKESPFDAIMMDVQMPGMDGLEATRRIRKLPNGQSLPIIALTGNAFPEDIKRCSEAGMNEVLAKPYPPDMLFVTLLKWLSREEHV